jgi:hypothetical protein
VKHNTSTKSTKSKAGVTTTWFTHDNGGSPYKVVYLKEIVHIYIATYIGEEPTYSKLIKSYNNVEKLFVGKSLTNKTTIYSGGHGPKFDGNSILLRLPNGKYTFIGHLIYEFTPPEPITSYYSTVGNNDVPYPVALSKSYVYFMLGTPMGRRGILHFNTLEYMTKRDFPKNQDWSDAYHDFYDLPDKTKIMYLKQKIIAARIW